MQELDAIARLIDLLAEQERSTELATLQQFLVDQTNRIEQLLWTLYQAGGKTAA